MLVADWRRHWWQPLPATSSAALCWGFALCRAAHPRWVGPTKHPTPTCCTEKGHFGQQRSKPIGMWATKHIQQLSSSIQLAKTWGFNLQTVQTTSCRIQLSPSNAVCLINIGALFWSNWSAINVGAYHSASVEIQSWTRRLLNLQYMTNTSLHPQLVTFECELACCTVASASQNCIKLQLNLVHMTWLHWNAFSAQGGREHGQPTSFDLVSFPRPLSFEVSWGTTITIKFTTQMSAWMKVGTQCCYL